MANVAYSEPSRTKMIVGAIINQPDLLDTDEAQRLEDFDFTDPLHRMVYFTVHNLYQEGHSKINGALIDQYLSVRPRMYEYFNSNEGYEFVNEAVEIGAPTSFKPNVERVKKLSLLRGLSGIGVDVSFIYDWQTEDLSAFQKQSDNVDRMSILELGSLISDRIDSIIDGAAGGSSVSTSIHGSDGFRSLIAGFKDAPEMGSPLYGGLINTITRGARLGKFYLGSAPTGGGKTRLMVGDAVNFAVDTIYDKKKKQWVDNGIKEGSLFITTELDETEIQTLVAAFMTDINESLILDGRVTEEQDERLDTAADILEDSPFWIEHIPDFSIGEIERIIRRHVRENDVKYVA